MFEPFRHRPLVQIALALIAGVALGPFPLMLWFAAPIAIGLACVRLWWPALLCTFVLCGWTLALKPEATAEERPLLVGIRERMEQDYAINLTPTQATMADALMFGEQDEAPYKVKEAMRRAGVYHILSTSGLHVAIVGFMMGGLLWLVGLPRVVWIPASIVGLFLYAGMAGGTPPVLRSAVGLSLYLGAFLVRREPDALSALAGAAVYQTIATPHAIQLVGFQLSYVTTAALILWAPVVCRVIDYRLPGKDVRLWRQLSLWVLCSLAVSSVASIASAPIVALYFGEVPLLGVFGNLLAVPALAPILFAGWVGPAIPLWMPFWITGVMGPGIDWIVSISERISGLSWATVAVPAFNAWWLVPFYAALFGLAKEWRRDVD